MFRLYIAAWLLRTTGASVRYLVRRVYAGTTGRGTTVLNVSDMKHAKAKYNTMRVSDKDTVTITVEAVVAQRHGTIEAIHAVPKENEDE